MVERLFRMARSAYRAVSNPAVVECEGIYLPVARDVISRNIRRVMYREGYEAAERKVLQCTLSPDDRVLDLGGGMGLTATIAAKHVGSENVLVYEADPALEQVILETFRLNGVSPELRIGALGRAREAFLARSSDYWASQVRDSGDIRIALDDPEVVLGRFQPTYMVVDIEGGEAELLDNLPLPTVRRICLETHPEIIGRGGVTGILRALLAQGFELDVDVSIGRVLFLERSG